MTPLQHRLVVRSLLVASVCVLAGVLLLVTTTFRAGQRLSRQAMCYSSLNNIALALHVYSQTFGVLPRPFVPDDRGERMHSWRPLLFRWYDSQNNPHLQRYDLTQAWDSPRNQDLTDEGVGWLRCPAWNVAKPNGSPFVMPNDFGDTALAAIPDNAILVIEDWGANRNWLDPHDSIAIDTQHRIPKTEHPHGFGLILGDFSVHRVQDSSLIRKSGPYEVFEPLKDGPR